MVVWYDQSSGCSWVLSAGAFRVHNLIFAPFFLGLRRRIATALHRPEAAPRLPLFREAFPARACAWDIDRHARGACRY